MPDFDDRKKAFEAKYAHDEEMKFKAEARRNRLLGLWAAGEMGKSDDEAQAYAKEVIRADFEEAGDEDVYRKIKGDLDAAGVDMSEHRVRRQMQDLMARAMKEIMEQE